MNGSLARHWLMSVGGTGYWGRLRRLAPLGAGVLLLAYLGFGGERTDVGAHVAGFAVGLAVGWVLARWYERVPRGPRAQWRYGGLAACTLLMAWLVALL